MSNRRNTSTKRRKAWQPYLRLPAFLPVPLRPRRDGWTADRQAKFIGLLAQTGCVRTAARAVGLSRESAYRLRRHPEAGSFINAWNTAIKGRTQPRWKFTQADRTALAFGDLLQPRMWRRRFVGIQRKSSNSALLALLSSLDRQTAGSDMDPFGDRQVQALFGRFW